MLRFKIFRGEGPELEASVNGWLDRNDPDITHVVQSEGEDGAVTVSFIFQESFRAQEARFAREHGVEAGTRPVASLEDIPEEPLPVEARP